MPPFYRFFYIDSPENARKNEMVVNTKHEKEISNQYVESNFRRNNLELTTSAFSKFPGVLKKTEGKLWISTIPSSLTLLSTSETCLAG